MAVTPKEILAQLSVKDEISLRENEEYIDRELRSKFTGEPVYLTLEGCNQRVFEELQKLYSSWNITRAQSGYNELAFKFEPKGSAADFYNK